MSEVFFAQKFQTKNKVISFDSRPYLVAEVGINHDGRLQQGLDIIEQAAESGADAVKFQSYTTKFFISRSHSAVHSLYDIFSQVELSLEQHRQFAQKANSLGLDFFSTPLTLDWLQHLKEMKVPFFKVASGDVNNFQLLLALTKQETPIFHSTGAASFFEIERAAAFYRQMNFSQVLFFHCVSLYPAALDKLNLATIPKISQQLRALVGFSDHSHGAWAAFAAVAAGAVVIEKHFTSSKELSGPDHAISADPHEMKDLRQKIDLAFSMRGQAKIEALDEETSGDFYGKRSLYRLENGKVLAMRPRQKHLPKDSDFFTNVLNTI